MATDTIMVIKKRLLKAIEAGEDTAELTRELAEARARVVAEYEVEMLQKIADDRVAFRFRAAEIMTKVNQQDMAIDELLRARDILISQLDPLLEDMKRLVAMAASGWESGFNDITQFALTVRQIPADGYLPADFGCPFLEFTDGKADAVGKVTEAYGHLMACFGILSSLKKGLSTTPQVPAGELMALDDEPERTCLVCDCAEVEGINAALKAGRSLRDVEAEFGVSRSSIARHKNSCLNLSSSK